MALNNLDEGLRRGYFRSLISCLDRLNSAENNPYIKQISDILGVYLIGEKHGQGNISHVSLNLNSGLPEAETIQALKQQIEMSRPHSYVKKDDVIISFFRNALVAGAGKDLASETREQLYWSELKNLSDSVNGFSADNLNFDCSGRELNMFFNVSNYYDFVRDGNWISYKLVFEEPIADKVNGNINEVKLSQFLDAQRLLYHISTKVGIVPSYLEEGVIGPLAYSGAPSRSQFRGLCQKPGSFVLDYYKNVMQADGPGYIRQEEHYLFCSRDMDDTLAGLSANNRIIPVGGEAHGRE